MVMFWIIVAIFVYLVSTNSEERKATFIHNWKLRGGGLQGFKSVIVVFQILTQARVATHNLCLQTITNPVWLCVVLTIID